MISESEPNVKLIRIASEAVWKSTRPLRGIGLTVMAMLLAIGCNEVPTFKEVTNQPANEPAQPRFRQIKPTTAKIVEPPPRSPDEVIADFRELNPEEVTDEDLEELLSLESGL